LKTKEFDRQLAKRLQLINVLEQAKSMLELNGYVVAKRPESFDSNQVAFYMRDEWAAFRLHDKSRFLSPVQPKDFCRAVGISPKTLVKKLKDPNCPPYTNRRGDTGRLVWLIPNQALIMFVVRDKQRLTKGKQG